ncbi:MAG TPA: hypothetical protein VKM72_35770 [Thermoanaerobaculia bacterium]|nr:hypothetical protein [Thermoanaerobaculia bacterium]
MISQLSENFLDCFRKLPEGIKRTARKNYRLWKENPSHPSLDFKRVHTRRPVYSVRVGIGWRALGIREGDTIVWFWIGPHGAYERLLEQL